MLVNSSGDVHVNSRGAMEHRNSCNSHAAELRERGPKSLSLSTLCKVGRPAEKELGDALTKMEEEERLHEEEVEDLRRRIAEEREGRVEEREGRVLQVMEVTETAVEGGVADKKKVKRVGEGKALG